MLKQNKHLVYRLFGVINANAVINICAARGHFPAFRNGHGKIGGFVFFRFCRFCRCLCYFNVLFGFCGFFVSDGVLPSFVPPPPEHEALKTKRTAQSKMQKSFLFLNVIANSPKIKFFIDRGSQNKILNNRIFDICRSRPP